MVAPKLWPAVLFLFLLGNRGLAQQVSRAEVFGGYSYFRINPASGEGANFNGWNAAFQGNVNSYFSLVADFSGAYQNDEASVNIHSFLGGPRITKRLGKTSPFAHALFGAARAEASAFGVGVSETKFAMALGGGVDLEVTKRTSVRLVQADYVMTRFADQTQNNIRLSFGIVLHLGSLR